MKLIDSRLRLITQRDHFEATFGHGLDGSTDFSESRFIEIDGHILVSVKYNQDIADKVTGDSFRELTYVTDDGLAFEIVREAVI